MNVHDRVRRWPGCAVRRAPEGSPRPGRWSAIPRSAPPADRCATRPPRIQWLPVAGRRRPRRPRPVRSVLVPDRIGTSEGTRARPSTADRPAAPVWLPRPPPVRRAEPRRRGQGRSAPPRPPRRDTAWPCQRSRARRPQRSGPRAAAPADRRPASPPERLRQLHCRWPAGNRRRCPAPPAGRGRAEIDSRLPDCGPTPPAPARRPRRDRQRCGRRHLTGPPHRRAPRPTAGSRTPHRSPRRPPPSGGGRPEDPIAGVPPCPAVIPVSAGSSPAVRTTHPANPAPARPPATGTDSRRSCRAARRPPHGRGGSRHLPRRRGSRRCPPLSVPRGQCGVRRPTGRAGRRC